MDRNLMIYFCLSELPLGERQIAVIKINFRSKTTLKAENFNFAWSKLRQKKKI